MELLERSEALAVLDAALAESAVEGRMVLVAGEAGVGKSALVSRFVRGHSGGDSRLAFATGGCDPLLTPRVLGPLSDIAPRLDPAIVDMLVSGEPRERVFAAVLDRLRSGAHRWVVVIEDVHWADGATLDLLLVLGRRIAETAALLVVTFRDDELSAEHPLRGVLGALPRAATRQLDLHRLSRESVAALARAAGLPAEELYRDTGGNPLLLREMLACGAAEVPGTIRDLVLARLATVPPEAREIAQLMSVIPGCAESWLLERLLGTRSRLVDTLAAIGLLIMTPEGVRFRHELFRRAVRDSLSGLRQREHNRRVLAVLAGVPGIDVARLAHHARAAGDSAAVLRYAPAAAHQAVAVAAHRQAAEHFRAAADHAAGLPVRERADLLEAFAFHAYVVGWRSDAFEAWRIAGDIRAAVGDLPRAGEDLRWLSRLCWLAGQRRDAERYAERAIALLERVAPGRELAMAYGNRCQLDMLAARTRAAVGWGRRAISLAERLDDTEALAHALTSIGAARLAAGEQSGRDDLERAFTMASVAGMDEPAVRALYNLSAIALENRNHARAAGYLDRGRRFAADRDLAGPGEYLSGLRAWLLLDTGDWQAAMVAADAALGHREQAGIMAVPALVALGRLRMRRGEAGADGALREAAALAFPTGEPQRVVPVAAARAEQAWLRGDTDRVAVEALRYYDLAAECGFPWLLGELRCWLHRAGAASPPAPPVLPEPCRLLLAGDPIGSAAAWQRLCCPYEQALALAEAGDDGARLRALRLLDGLGARVVAQRLRRDLREHGRLRVPRGPRPATAANPAMLTGRQLEILGLLAERLSNAEIAERLSLSRRTVDHHVSAVLAKLGAGSRGDAVSRSAARGLLPPQTGQPDRPM